MLWGDRSAMIVRSDVHVRHQHDVADHMGIKQVLRRRLFNKLSNL